VAGARATGFLSLALAAAAALFALTQLYVPALALALLALAALGWVEAAARGARVRALPSPPTVEEGKPYPLRLEVNWGRAPPPSGELSHPALSAPLPVGLGAPPDLVAELRFERWGPQQIEAPVLAVRDPLGLHERRVQRGAGPRVLVLPRVEPLRTPVEGEGADHGRRPGQTGVVAGGRAAQALEPEIDGLRPWRQGSPASRIHWPTLARTGELLERNLTGGGDSSPLVVLDRSRRAEEEPLRRAVRAAASLCLHLARAGGCSLLLPGERRVLAVDRELRSWPRVHARLALVDPERPAPAHPPPGARTIFWVTPAGAPDLGPAGRDGGYLVTPAALPDARPAFEVAGCRGYPLAAASRSVAEARGRPRPLGARAA
jgi:uncharacterized protein (DUF58 family)